VKMRRQMVRGVEPEIQAFQDNDLYLSHARLGFIEPPEYEYTSYRTDWQSIALDRCPVLLNSGSESALIGSLRPPGEDGPTIDDGRAGENDAAQNRCPFSPVFGASHSTIKRSHSTSCELLTSGMPSWGLLAFRHLFVPKSAPKPVPCLTAFESAPFVFKRLERVGDWCPVITFSETPRTFRPSLA
jgi:hypothetical protein